MNQSSLDAGVIATLLERLEKPKLPRLLVIQVKVDAAGKVTVQLLRTCE